MNLVNPNGTESSAFALCVLSAGFSGEERRGRVSSFGSSIAMLQVLDTLRLRCKCSQSNRKFIGCGSVFPF